MLVDIDDLSTYMDMAFSNRQMDSAEMVLAGVQVEIEAELKRPLEHEEFDETYWIPEEYRMTVDPDISYIRAEPFGLHVRNAPIQSVDTVLVRTKGEPNFVERVEGIGYVVKRWGIDIFDVLPHDEVRIIYTAGIDAKWVPFLKLLILRKAAAEMQTQVDDTMGIAELTTQAQQPRTAGLTDEDRKTLRRLQRKQI